MYKRQQNQLNIPPELQEQTKFPIFNIVYGLNQGRTQKVALKTLDGFFVSAVNGGGGLVLANSTSIGPNETFLLIPQGLNREKVAIRTSNGYFLRAVDGGGGSFIVGNVVEIGPNETFLLIPQGLNRDKVAIRTVNRNYLNCIGGGLVGARSTNISENEQFYMIPIDSDKASFVTISGFFFLVLTSNPYYLTSYGLSVGTRTTFTIIPIEE